MLELERDDHAVSSIYLLNIYLRRYVINDVDDVINRFNLKLNFC